MHLRAPTLVVALQAHLHHVPSEHPQEGKSWLKTQALSLWVCSCLLPSQDCCPFLFELAVLFLSDCASAWKYIWPKVCMHSYLSRCPGPPDLHTRCRPFHFIPILEQLCLCCARGIFMRGCSGIVWLRHWKVT